MQSSPRELLNWRPVDDIEQRTRQFEFASLESETRLKQLRNESEQLKSETERLKNENKRPAALESRLETLLLNAASSSPTPPATGSS